MRWCALAALGLAVILPTPARVQTRSAAHAGIVTHGLRLTLEVSRRTYPGNAVIVATLSIRNISRHAVSIMSGLNTPQVAVLDDSGHEVYDPGTPLGHLTLVPRTGPGPESFRLLPHKSWTAHDYLVLRGNTLETRVILGDAHTSSPEVSIDRPRLALRLTSEPAPQVVLSSPPLTARVIPPSPRSTSLVSVGEWRCGNVFSGSAWVTVNRGITVPLVGTGCRPGIWHALAGWLNHPVATTVFRATTKKITVSTTPSPRLQPPDAASPAAGICAHAQGPIARVQINVDTPSPRCELVKPEQRLQVVNTLDRFTTVRLAHFAVRLAPRQALSIAQPFGTYLAPGVHDLAISAYAGGGAELWLRT